MKYLLIFILILPMIAADQTQTSPNQPLWDKDDDHNFISQGTVTSDLIQTLDVFKARTADYKADPTALQDIKNYSTPAEIKVIFGDWCADSKKHVPAFLKIMELAANPNLKTTYINVDRQKKQPADLISPFNIEHVPTFIVLSNGHELGRIVENPKISIEQDLADILTGVAAAD